MRYLESDKESYGGGTRHENNYLVHYHTIGCTNMVAITIGWLGYMIEKEMNMLLVVSKDKLSALKSMNIQFCETHVFEKQKRMSFTKIQWLLVPEEVRSYAHRCLKPIPKQISWKFSLLCYLNSTRKVWVYFKKHKLEVNEKLDNVLVVKS